MKKNFMNEMKIISGSRLNKPAGAQNPQFPGLQLDPNLTIEQIREFIRKQKKVKGFRIDLATGSELVPNDIQLSGDARILLGLNLVTLNAAALYGTATDFPNQVTLEVNNEIVITTVHGFALSAGFMEDEYFYFPRPLSGQDDITLKASNDTGESITFYAHFYYI